MSSIQMELGIQTTIQIPVGYSNGDLNYGQNLVLY